MTTTRGPIRVIYGGVDDRFLNHSDTEAASKVAGPVLFTGRLLPHKGINYLIDALDPTMPLSVNGRPYDQTYLQLLRSLARDKCVSFRLDATDEDLVEAYQNATVTVLPSVYRDVYGQEYAAPELLGLVLLESMACGTPVICTDVGAMPEFVEDGVTGFVVPPNDPAALNEKLRWLFSHPEQAMLMGQRGRQRVLERYSWRAVVERCLNAYKAF